MSSAALSLPQAPRGCVPDPVAALPAAIGGPHARPELSPHRPQTSWSQPPPLPRSSPFAGASPGITPTILDEVGAAISAGEFMPAEVAAQSFPARQRAHKVLVGQAVAALLTEGQPNHEPEGELAELLGW